VRSIKIVWSCLIGHMCSADIVGQLNVLRQEIMQPVRWLLFCNCRANAVEQSAWTASATGHHLRITQTIVENVCVWLVGPRRLVCLNIKGADYKSSYLLTYLLRADDDWRTVDTVERECQTLAVTVHFMWPQELFATTDPGRHSGKSPTLTSSIS